MGRRRPQEIVDVMIRRRQVGERKKKTDHDHGSETGTERVKGGKGENKL